VPADWENGIDIFFDNKLNKSLDYTHFSKGWTSSSKGIVDAMVKLVFHLALEKACIGVGCVV